MLHENFGLISKEEIVGKQTHFIAHPDDRERLAEEIENWASVLDDSSLYELRGMRRDGTWSILRFP